MRPFPRTRSHRPWVFALVLLLGCTSDGAEPSGPVAGGTADAWPLEPASGLRVPQLGPVPALPDWSDNPATPDKAYLGRVLFSDHRLSGSGGMNCGSCHFALAHFQSNAPRDTPSRSAPSLKPVLHRNTPSLLNVVYAPELHWDGFESDLYESMVLPFAEANMNLTNVPSGDNWTLDVPEAQRQLYDKLTTEIPGYAPLFEAAFDVDIGTVPPEEVWTLTGKALAIYARDAVSRDSAFDDWNAGGETELDEAALLGLEVFLGKGRCVSCHGGPFLSDFQFHNLSLMAIGEDGEPVDEGRFRVTGRPEDRGAFLTPMLRGVNRTSPFWHDGSEGVLAKVVEHHASEAARTDPNHDPLLDGIEPLSDAEVAGVVALLKSFEGAVLRVDGELPELP